MRFTLETKDSYIVINTDNINYVRKFKDDIGFIRIVFTGDESQFIDVIDNEFFHEFFEKWEKNRKG